MRLALVLIVMLSACAEFPALEDRVGPAQTADAFPQLVPLAPLVARAGVSNSAAAITPAALSPRLANLRARAARLRGPVIPPAARARMLRTIR